MGHPPAIHVRNGFATVLAAPHGPPLGVDPPPEYGDGPVGLDPGDLFVLYTDGVVERRDEPVDEGIERLAALVAKNSRVPVDELADTVVDQLCRDPDDDCCVLVVRRVAAPADAPGAG